MLLVAAIIAGAALCIAGLVLSYADSPDRAYLAVLVMFPAALVLFASLAVWLIM